MMTDLYIKKDGHQKEIYFNLDSDLEEAVSEVYKLSKNYLFWMFWKKQFHAHGAESHAWSAADIVGKVWTTAKEELRQLITSLISQEISYSQVRSVFKDYKEKADTLCGELLLLDQILYGEKEQDWVYQVIPKIMQIFSLDDCHSNARCILEIGKSLNLKGDFSVFETIADQVKNNLHYFCSLRLVLGWKVEFIKKLI